MPEEVQTPISSEPVTVEPAPTLQESAPPDAVEPTAAGDVATTEAMPTVAADSVAEPVQPNPVPAPSVPTETVTAANEHPAEQNPAEFISATPPVSPSGGPSAAPAAAEPGIIFRLLAKANAALHFRRRAKLEKIIQLAGKKESIANDDVEKLLRVSHATATRYLSALAKEGALEPFGPPHRTRFRLKG